MLVGRRNLQIERDLDPRKEVLQDLQVEGRIEHNDRQLGDPFVNVATTVDPQAEHRAVLGVLHIDAQTARRIVGTGEKLFDGAPHRGALAQLPKKPEFLGARFGRFSTALGRQIDLDLSPPLQLGRSRTRPIFILVARQQAAARSAALVR